MKSKAMDLESAKAAAKRLFQKVNFTGGPLQAYEISSLLTDTYDYLQQPYKPNTHDIKMYTEVLDANRDGQVTLEDLESKAIQYLCGPGVLQNTHSNIVAVSSKYSTSGVSGGSYSHSQHQSDLPSHKNISLSNGYQQQSAPSRDLSQLQNASGGSPSFQKQQNQGAQRDYSDQAQHYISLSKQIFQRYATEYGTITEERVPALLGETYELLGRKGYSAGREDVRVWMSLCDDNRDGHVQFEQYCYFVLRQLEEGGYQIYK